MKTLTFCTYLIGSILLIASCFTQNVTLTWWLGGGAVVALIIGCIFQFRTTKQQETNRINEYRKRQ